MPDEPVVLEFETFVRKPFTVKAVLITRDNIKEVADIIGRVQYKRENGEPYIRVSPRTIPNLQYVYLGFYMTEMVVKTDTQEFTNYRCYSSKAFAHQFVQHSDNVQKWIDFLNSPEANPQEEQPEEEAEAETEVSAAQSG